VHAPHRSSPTLTQSPSAPAPRSTPTAHSHHRPSPSRRLSLTHHVTPHSSLSAPHGNSTTVHATWRHVTTLSTQTSSTYNPLLTGTLSPQTACSSQATLNTICSSQISTNSLLLTSFTLLLSAPHRQAVLHSLLLTSARTHTHTHTTSHTAQHQTQPRLPLSASVLLSCFPLSLNSTNRSKLS
jgi:hypothetical protein